MLSHVKRLNIWLTLDFISLSFSWLKTINIIMRELTALKQCQPDFSKLLFVTMLLS